MPGLDILFLDDDQVVCEILAAQMKRLGHAVTVVTDSKAAVELLRSRSDFDVLVTDISMPGNLSGVDVATTAWNLSEGRIRIIFLTGFLDMTKFSEPLSKLDYTYLKKPVRKAQLAEALTTGPTFLRALASVPVDRS